MTVNSLDKPVKGTPTKGSSQGPSKGSPSSQKRQAAIHRAKEAHRLFITHGIKPIGFGLAHDHYKWFDFETRYCVELKNNGALKRAFI
jgi:hypothetical protein